MCRTIVQFWIQKSMNMSKISMSKSFSNVIKKKQKKTSGPGGPIISATVSYVTCSSGETGNKSLGPSVWFLMSMHSPRRNVNTWMASLRQLSTHGHCFDIMAVIQLLTIVYPYLTTSLSNASNVTMCIKHCLFVCFILFVCLISSLAWALNQMISQLIICSYLRPRERIFG